MEDPTFKEKKMNEAITAFSNSTEALLLGRVMGSDEGADTTGMVQDQQRTAPVTKRGTSQMRMKIMTESRMLAGQGTEAWTQSQAGLHHQPATARHGAA